MNDRKLAVEFYSRRRLTRITTRIDLHDCLCYHATNRGGYVVIQRRLLFVLSVVAFAAGIANASWLSDATGINIDLARQVNTPIVLNAAKQPVTIVPPLPQPVAVAMATPEDITKLREETDQAVAAFQVERDKYNSYALSSVMASLLLALGAAISGFLKKPVAAGILSLIVMGSTAGAKAIPIKERATYYQTLYSQARALKSDLAVHRTLSADDFNAHSEQLHEMWLYGAKLPGLGDAEIATDELIKNTGFKKP